MMIKKILFSGIFILCFYFGKAQDFFSSVSERSIKTDLHNRTVQPEKFLTYKLDVSAIKNYFSSLPELGDADFKGNAPIIILPMADGSKARFRV